MSGGAGLRVSIRVGPGQSTAKRRKHGISFTRAASAFLDRRALSEYDVAHSRAEDRWITIGLDRVGTLLVVGHTYEEESSASVEVRIISARRASQNEVSQY